MPITEQLQTSEQLERAGLPHAAAVLLAEKIEAAAQATHDTAFDRFRAELNAFRAEVRAEFAGMRADMNTSNAELRAEIAGMRADMNTSKAELRVEIATSRAELEKSIRMFQTVLLSAIGLAVAILVALKFFA